MSGKGQSGRECHAGREGSLRGMAGLFGSEWHPHHCNCDVCNSNRIQHRREEENVLNQFDDEIDRLEDEILRNRSFFSVSKRYIDSDWEIEFSGASAPQQGRCNSAAFPSRDHTGEKDASSFTADPLHCGKRNGIEDHPGGIDINENKQANRKSKEKRRVSFESICSTLYARTLHRTCSRFDNHRGHTDGADHAGNEEDGCEYPSALTEQENAEGLPRNDEESRNFADWNQNIYEKGLSDMKKKKKSSLTLRLASTIKRRYISYGRSPSLSHSHVLGIS